MQQDHYGSIAKFLHWVIALLIMINYVLGLLLDKTSLYNVHKQIGLTILVLVILRILWRILSSYPAMLGEIPKYEKIAAKTTYILLYILMVSIPIGGILLVESHGYPLTLWSLITLPTIISSQPNNVSHIILLCHEYAAHTIIALATLHMLAAIKHYCINKDRVLLRMLPFYVESNKRK